MNPTVVAAWIAAGVSALTLVGTLLAQYFGRRGTSGDAEKAFAEQRKQLNETLKAQSDQLDKTLGEQRTRTWNERFATAAEQLGSDKPAVRLAGVYAMAGLADDWAENRQTCIDVLCGYLRMPYEQASGEESPVPEQLAFQASREVRHSVIRIITAHLQDAAAVSWQGLNFDFTGVVFDGGSFSGARFSGGTVSFRRAQFSGEVIFNFAQFSGGMVDFSWAWFYGMVWFSDAEFSGGKVNFIAAQFSGGQIIFAAQFSGGTVNFDEAEFSGGQVRYVGAHFSGGTVNFNRTRFSGSPVYFGDARFSGGRVDFKNAVFSDGEVDFRRARFCGGTVNFRWADFAGGAVDFSGADDWSFPPAFPWTDMPPSGVQLPLPGAA